MTDNSSLMAYLVPRPTGQVENAATEALGYILNRSDGSMQALNDLLREDSFAIEPIVRVETQVSYEDRSRPDMAGYDKRNATRLLVEAKFDAPLLEGQASGYSRLLDQPGPAALLFIVPERRIPTVWAEIERQMEGQSKLEPIGSLPAVRRAKVLWTEPSDTELQLVLIGWVRLLERMGAMAGDDGIKSDIKGFAATSQRYGYGRYCRFSGVSESCGLWFGINHERWARDGNTPLWLRVLGLTEAMMDDIVKELNVQVRDEWIPIHLKTGVEYDKVLDDVVSQLKKIAEVARNHLPSE